MSPGSGQSVLEAVVRPGYCVGCGLCAGVCPRHCLAMGWEEQGQLRPYAADPEQCRRCGLCLRVCPFGRARPNEDDLSRDAFGQIAGMASHPDLGRHLACYGGHVTDAAHRGRAASGGLTTWLLMELLSSGRVDRVACVIPCQDGERLFRYQVVHDPAQVLAGAKSCYYPVDLSQVVRELTKDIAPTAVVGLPCFLKGLRRAARVNAKLGESLSFFIGLTCGRSQSALFSQFVCALGGGDPSRLKSMQFRVKGEDRTAHQYGHRFECQGGAVGEGVAWREPKMDRAWSLGWFTPRACLFCDDLFSEVADAVFMDAWLPRFASDAAGNNLAVARNPELNGILMQGREQGRLALDALEPGEVVQAQQGTLATKRQGLAHRLAMAQRRGEASVPAKRVAALLPDLVERCRIRQEWRLAARARAAFLARRGDFDLAAFQRDIAWSWRIYLAICFLQARLRPPASSNSGDK